jgi:hypothetical protein
MWEMGIQMELDDATEILDDLKQELETAQEKTRARASPLGSRLPAAGPTSTLGASANGGSKGFAKPTRPGRGQARVII